MIMAAYRVQHENPCNGIIKDIESHNEWIIQRDPQNFQLIP